MDDDRLHTHTGWSVVLPYCYLSKLHSIVLLCDFSSLELHKQGNKCNIWSSPTPEACKHHTFLPAPTFTLTMYSTYSKINKKWKIYGSLFLSTNVFGNNVCKIINLLKTVVISMDFLWGNIITVYCTIMRSFGTHSWMIYELTKRLFKDLKRRWNNCLNVLRES